jgi:CheY-like chemotaxis protein
MVADGRELQPSAVSADTTKVPHTLLLADDSVTIQRVIELTFADEDITVVAVSDGDQAIARLQASPPDIVLADVGMPGKSGYEVAQFIKQSPQLAHIPVVLLTGAFEPVDQARAAEAGCDGVLAKPFEPQLVIGRVKELLAFAPGRPASAPARALDMPLAPPPAPAEAWTPALAEQPLDAAPSPSPTGGAGDLANYFDRLDEAFANLSTVPAPPTASDIATLAEPHGSMPTSVPNEIDWFGDTAADATPSSLADQIDAAAPPSMEELQADVPLSYASPESAFEVPVDLHVEPLTEAAIVTFEPESLEAPEALEAPHAPEVPQALQAPVFALPSRPVPLPSLADAFAALLAAEQGETTAPPMAWPVAAPSTDALADEISRRVLDQLSPRIEATVRTAVGELVSELAERLVLEEIERIKAAIK